MTRVALVVMPWIDVEIPPLGAAALKAHLISRGMQADVHYLNLRMARRLGPLMTALSEDSLWPDWLFAYHVFGPGGSGELREELGDVLRDPGFERFRARAGLTPQRLRALLHEDIPAFFEEALEAVDWERYDLAGFSSLMCTHMATLAFSQRLKARFPSLPVAVGGSNVEGEKGRATLRACPWIDAVVDGEGEAALEALAREAAAGRLRRGARRGAPLDMALLPTPDHSDYFAQRAEAGLDTTSPVVTFEASRGCWWGQKHHCTFCGLNGQSMAFRSKPAALVVRDVLELHRRHRALRLRAVDNILAVEHMRELLPELARVKRERGVDWELFFETKANLTPAQVELFKAAGVAKVQPGIESLSSKTLSLMRKGVTALQNAQTLKAAAVHGVSLAWNVLLGFPGEEAAEYPLAAERALALTHLPPPEFVGQVRPDRYSPYERTPRAFGVSAVEPSPEYARLYPRPRFSLREAAHFFRFPEAHERAAARRCAPLREAAELWRRVWPNNYFFYARGAGFLELYDSRPLSAGASPQWRREVVEGLEMFLLLRAEWIASEAELARAAVDAGAARDRKQAASALARLEGRRWILREGGRCLALAVPRERLPAPQKAAFGRLARLEKLLLRRKSWPRTRKEKAETTGRRSAGTSSRS